jgi:hypothetical protein
MHHSTLGVKNCMMTGSFQNLSYPKEIQDQIDCREGHENSLIKKCFLCLHGKWIDGQF